jgi:hypothetical protein
MSGYKHSSLLRGIVSGEESVFYSIITGVQSLLLVLAPEDFVGAVVDVDLGPML